MASIYDLKSRFQNLLRPSTRWLVAHGVTANQVTMTAIGLSLATGSLVYWKPESRWAMGLVPIVLFFRMALNAMDGMIAREYYMESRLGAVLNELGDVASDGALYLPLGMIPGVRSELVVVVVLLGVFSEMAGVVAIQIGAERRYDGPMGKSDRAFLFGLICFLLACGFQVGPWITWILLGMSVLLGQTIWNRSRRAIRAAIRAASLTDGSPQDDARD